MTTQEKELLNYSQLLKKHIPKRHNGKFLLWLTLNDLLFEDSLAPCLAEERSVPKPRVLCGEDEDLNLGGDTRTAPPVVVEKMKNALLP